MGYGEFMAATAAACWASSSIIYSRTLLSAWAINYAKNLFAAVFALFHLFLLWLILGSGFLQLDLAVWGWLILSGIIGIAIGDTFYFRSMQILGPRRSLVVATTSPIFGALLGWLILGEVIKWNQLAGIVIAILGIGVVVMDKRGRKEAPGLYPGSEWAGVAMGLVAAVCQATGGAISKIGMRDCTPLEATFVRLLSAVVVGSVLFGATGKLKSTLQAITSKENFKKLLPAAAVGTWMGIWFSQIGFKHTSVAAATMFASTSPLFAIPLVRWIDGHKVSAKAIWGMIVALIGLAIMVGFGIPDNG